MNLTNAEIRTLRELAREFARIAELPVHEEKRAEWRAFNDCKMRKPMVLIDQLPWNELNVDPFLQCTVQEPYWRYVEQEMRRTIYKWNHLPVDMVVDPYLCLPRPIINSGYGMVEVEDRLALDPQTTAASHHYYNQILEMDDVEKIQMPQISLDTEKEAEIIRTAEMLFYGIIPFRMTGSFIHLGVWDKISTWMGVENCYIELLDRPELMHAVMGRLTDALIYQIGQMNALGLWDVYSNITHCSHTYSDYLPGGDTVKHATSYDAWTLGLAQLFTSVSPAITKEFEVEYMKRVFPFFGAIYYGCCDRLDDRLDIITQMPNIRKISCSPWSNREAFAANLPKGYIMSNKPSPAILATDTLDEGLVRADLRRTIKAAKEHNVPLEMILKDVSTVRNDPQRLWRWAEIAREETEAAAE